MVHFNGNFCWQSKISQVNHSESLSKLFIYIICCFCQIHGRMSCHVFYKSYVVYLDYSRGANSCSAIIICMIQGEHSGSLTGWLPPQLKLPLSDFFFLMHKLNTKVASTVDFSPQCKQEAMELDSGEQSILFHSLGEVRDQRQVWL